MRQLLQLLIIVIMVQVLDLYVFTSFFSNIAKLIVLFVRNKINLKRLSNIGTLSTSVELLNWLSISL